MKRRRGTVRVRLALWYAGALATILLLFAGGVYLFARQGLAAYVSQQLGDDYSAIEKLARHDPGELAELEDHGVAGIFRVDEDDRLLFQTAEWRRLDLDGRLKPEVTDDEWIVESEDDQHFRVRVGSFSEGTRHVRIAVAMDVEPVMQALHRIGIVLLVALPIAFALSLLGGYVLAGRLLSPVAGMAAKARQITAERLSERLPVENPSDEFGQLAHVFNHTLARLEDSFERLRRFTSDASHELRTPLTALRSVGEVALREGHDAAHCREAIGSMLEEVDRLTRLVESLLLLTRADAGTVRLAIEQVDIVKLANDAAEHMRPLAEVRSQTIVLDTDQIDTAKSGGTVAAERITLRHALINLLDNAIKYSPDGTVIRVSIFRAATVRERSSLDDAEKTTVIAVTDEGPGIPPEEQQRIFERFYRIDKARSRDSGSVGLGLSIAKWAVEANGGCIEVDSEPGCGATFRIVLRQGAPITSQF